MKLAHDSAGFLIGERVIDIKRSNNLLSAIRSDVAAIKRAVVGISKPEKIAQTRTVNTVVSDRSNRQQKGGSNVVTPIARGARQDKKPNAAQVAVVVPIARKAIATAIKSEPGQKDKAIAATQNRGVIIPPAQKAVTPTVTRKRDAQGRFTSNGDDDDQKQRNLINGLGDRIAETITGFDSGLEEVDPTVKAFNEVAQPLARGYQSLLGGGDDKDTRWYRKILREITLFRKEDSAYNRAAKKSLKNIEDKSSVIDDDGGKSFWGGLIGSILPWLLGAIAGLGPLLLTGIKAVFGGFGAILRVVLAGVFSPIGLAIGAAAAASWGLFTENGRKFFADMGNRISDAWSAAVNLFSETFPSITDKFNQVADGIAELWQPVAKFFKDKFGIVGNAVSSAAKNATDFVKDKAGYGLDIAKDLVSKAAAKITGKASDNKAALIAEMKRAGITDPEEQAAFLAQNDHESAGFSRLEENLNYSPTRLMEVSKTARSKGLDAVRAAVAQGPEAVGELLYGGRLGNTEAGDGYKFRGRGFSHLTGRANYAKASKALGIDLVSNPDLAANPKIAARIATWFHQRDKKLVEASQSGDIKTARQQLNGGLNGFDDVVSKYGNYLAEAKAGKFVTAMTSVGSMVAAAPAQSVYSPSPRIPRPPATVAIPESPGVTMPLSSIGADKPVFVSLPVAEVGQNLSDRTIAHIALGGIGGV